MAEITIMKHVAIQKTIAVNGLALDKDSSGKKELYVNGNGDPLKKVQLQKAEFKWVNENTHKEETGKSYKSLNGKPIKAFSRTKEVKDYDAVKIADIPYFIENEKTYQLISSTLKAEVQALACNGEAMSFKYVNSGFKVYRAVVTYDELLGVVLMRCYRGDLRKVDLTETTVDEVQTQDDGVESMDLGAIEI